MNEGPTLFDQARAVLVAGGIPDREAGGIVTRWLWERNPDLVTAARRHVAYCDFLADGCEPLEAAHFAWAVVPESELEVSTDA